MPSDPSQFVWYELMTSDLDAAAAFYGPVVGWDIQDAGMPMPYKVLMLGQEFVGGLMLLPPEDTSAKPGWLGYISVSDVDDYAQQIANAGGVIHRAPADIPTIGRFAVAADPQGAVFVIFKGTTAPPPAPSGPAIKGQVGWRELHSGGIDGALAFYSSLFGWTKGETHDMGPQGLYQIFAGSGIPIGGMMSVEAMPEHFWLYYFVVDAIDAATDRIRQGGGQITMGPHQVPGGGWIVMANDPQGAAFALMSSTQ